jgi:hypothetical protein
MDLVRAILMGTADDADIDVAKYSREEVWYHVFLLEQAGYIKALIGPQQTLDFQIFCLTWEGNEFLDAMRDDTLWSKAKEKVIKPGASFTAKLLFEWLKTEIRQKLLGAGSEHTIS